MVLPVKFLKVSLLSLFSLLAACSNSNGNDIIDPNNEYIINPNHPLYKKYEWATWRDSPGGRLAHDPKWFILPADKYISKEVPFNWTSLKGKTALEKRNAYYSHLCQTESITYRTEDFPYDIKNKYTATSTWLYLRGYEMPVKNMKEIIAQDNAKGKEIFTIAGQNPYINPNFGFQNWQQGLNLLFSLRVADAYYYSMNYEQPTQDTFREHLGDDGFLYRIRFDIKTNKFLPLQKLNLEDSKAQYYTIYREIERPEMKKLGIFGVDFITYDRKSNKLIEYARFFKTPLYMDSLRNSGYQIPIDWHKSNNCIADNKTIINAF